MNKPLSPNPVIIIPTHKADPLPEELISLKQCQSLLGSREIYLITPDGMNIEAYKNILPNAKRLNVPPAMMESHQAYNRLMISPLLFDYFKGYSHILIHEPDAIILKDDLDYWCAQGYDYIGAPWFSQKKDGTLELRAVGNFGFALLNTKTINTIFNKNSRWYSPAMIIRDLLRGLRGKKTPLRNALMACGSAGKMSGAWKLYLGHCDVFWSTIAPKAYPQFKIAPATEAVYFSWETHIEECMKLSNSKLPFGIHAWSKYDPQLMKSIFTKIGI